jgi:hypothetical protein
MADSVAIYVGKTLAELLNRKDDLVAELSRIEQEIAVSGRAAVRLGQTLPAQLGRLRPKAKTQRAARPPARRATPVSARSHNAATKSATVVTRATSANDRAKESIRPRTAARGTRHK